MAIGKITPVTYEPDKKIKSMTNSLAAAGKSRYPGTGMYFFPKKFPNGRYATGLDENATSILSIQDEKLRKQIQEEVKQKRKRLEDATGFNLAPDSPYWNYSLYTDQDQAHVQPVKLYDKKNVFDLTNPINEVTFTWLKECDYIAPSYEDYMSGRFGPDIRFYVEDDEVETTIKFNRKKEINDAVIANNKLTPDKRKKIAVLLGLHVAENASDDAVFVILDDYIKEADTKRNTKLTSNVRQFMDLISVEAKLLNIKYTIKEALDYNVYRTRVGGSIYEGETRIADNESDLVIKLSNPDMQEDLLLLQRQVKNKKMLVLE